MVAPSPAIGGRSGHFIPRRTFRRALWKRLGYTPYPAQRAVHESDSRFRMLVWGRRTGKSTGVAAHEIVEEAAMPDRMIWTAAPTYELAQKVFNPVFSKIVYQLRWPTKAGTSLSKMRIVLPWGTEILGKSTKNEESCVGEGVDLLVADEFARIKRRTWEEALESTLIDRRGRALFITTPRGLDHVFEMSEVARAQMAAASLTGDVPDWFFSTVPTWGNPWLYPEEIARMALRWGGVDSPTYRQELGAQFVTYAGLVYFMWQPAIHVRPAPPRSEFKSFWVGVDWGFSPSAFVMLLVGRHRNGDLWVLDEVYETKLTPDERITLAHRWYDHEWFGARPGEEPGPLIDGFFPDPSQPDTILAWRREGFPMYETDNTIAEGIADVAGMLLNTTRDGTEGSRLYFAEKAAPKTERDMNRYRYPDQTEGTSLRIVPLKANDHGPDALRYVLRGANARDDVLQFDPAMIRARKSLVGVSRWP